MRIRYHSWKEEKRGFEMDTVLSAVSKMYGWDSGGETEEEESEGFPAEWLLNNFVRARIT